MDQERYPTSQTAMVRRPTGDRQAGLAANVAFLIYPISHILRTFASIDAEIR